MQFPNLKSGGEVGVTALSPGHQSPLEVMKWFGTSVCAWKSLHIGEFHCRLMECPPTMTLVTFKCQDMQAFFHKWFNCSRKRPYNPPPWQWRSEVSLNQLITKLFLVFFTQFSNVHDVSKYGSSLFQFLQQKKSQVFCV